MVLTKNWFQIPLGLLFFKHMNADVPRSFVPGSKCTRPCGGPPMNCYFDFKIENIYSMSKACFACPMVKEDCFRKDCIIAAGQQRTLTAANRQIPGPSIQVCRGDTVRIKVQNNLMNAVSTALHWHGIFMRDTPFMDGVPYVTQCPILSGTSFTYMFKMNQSGTYIWHAHNSLHRGDGLFGILVARDSEQNDPHALLYDFDKPEHVMIMMDWSDQDRLEMFEAVKMGDLSSIYDTTLLINGLGYTKGNGLPLANFEVQKGYRYRFRLINVGFADCNFEMSIDNHTFTVIAADAQDIEPIEVTSVMMFTGERYDIVIKADQPLATYWIRMKGYGNCATKLVVGMATLKYKGSSRSLPSGPVPNYSTGVNVSGTMLNHMDPLPPNSTVTVVTTNELRALEPMSEDVQQPATIRKFYLAFDVNRVESPYFNRPGYYGYDQVPPNYQERVPQINNIAYKNPSVTLLAGKKLNEVDFCNVDTVAQRNCTTKYCECTHLIEVAKDDIVELILLSHGAHPIHLHGYFFYVLAWTKLNFTFTRDDIIRMDQEGQLQRNLIKPPLKDTLPTPPGGYAIVRFKANNPGFWFLHCHLGFHVLEGMAMVLKVGDLSEMRPMPKGFPTCGNFDYPK